MHTERVRIVDLERGDIIIRHGRRLTVAGWEPAADLGGPTGLVALWWDARHEGWPSTHITEHDPGETVERLERVQVMRPRLVEDSELVEQEARA
jgi:hypothetical protein